MRELSFPIFFLKILNGENSGGMQSKRIYKSCKCFFKPLNTNFSKFFAQIWHWKKKKKKNLTLFFRILRSVGRGQHNNFFFWPYSVKAAMFFGSPEHLTSLRYKVLSPQRRRYVLLATKAMAREAPLIGHNAPLKNSIWPWAFLVSLLNLSIGPFTLAKTKIQKTWVFCCTVYTARKNP